MNVVFVVTNESPTRLQIAAEGGGGEQGGGGGAFKGTIERSTIALAQHTKLTSTMSEPEMDTYGRRKCMSAAKVASTQASSRLPSSFKTVTVTVMDQTWAKQI